jgi:hypothetical protein
MPPTLFKYLPHQYVELFVSTGAVLFRSLLYFLASEDARRDEVEGTHQYEPVDGLEITNQTQGWRRRMPGGSLRSSVKNPDKLFVFCTSHVLDTDLAVKFGSDACVEITDVGMFVARVRTALRRNPRVKLNTLIHGDVEYYRTAEPPQEVWALPDRIVMNKPHVFAHEQECRFAFSLKADTFRFENVDLKITTGPTPKIPKGAYPEMLVHLGHMVDCCRLHRF